MRTIQVDEDVYEHICRNTSEVGEGASSILRRLLGLVKHTDLRSGTSSLQSGASATTPAPARSNLEQLSPRLVDLQSRLLRLQTKQVLDRYLVILEWLYDQNPPAFEYVRNIRGAMRVYFSKDREEIEKSGQSTFPRRIGKSPWYVLTNTSTLHKRTDLTAILRGLQYSTGDQILILASLESPQPTKPTSNTSPPAKPPPHSSSQLEDDPFKI